MRRGRLRTAAFCAGLSLSLGACTEQVRLGAAWYIVAGEEPLPGAVADAGARPDCSPDKDRIVVALLNRGRKEQPVHHVALNGTGKDASLFPATVKGGPATLQPGELMVLPVSPETAARKIVPVRLFIWTREAQKRPVRLEIRGSMPSTLPSAWLPGPAACAVKSGTPPT